MYKFKTNIFEDKKLNGSIIVILEPPKYEEWKEEKGMYYVEFLDKGIKKWIYNTEIENL